MQFKIQQNTDFAELLDQIFGSSLIDPDVLISGGVPRLLWQGNEWCNHDVDLFFKNQLAFDRMKIRMDHLCQHNRSLIQVIKDMHVACLSQQKMFEPTKKEPYVTENATTYYMPFKGKEIKIQLIKKQYYQNIVELWNDFDFTVCQFAADQRYLYASNQAVKDCELKLLSMIKDTKRRIKAARVIKYGIYGFTPDSAIMQNLVTRHLAGESLLVDEGDNDDIEY